MKKKNTDLKSILLADVSVPLQDLQVLEDLPLAVLKRQSALVVTEQIGVVLGIKNYMNMMNMNKTR